MPEPKTAAIYARFSTDLQNDRSIDDQVALCRAHAARLGYAVVAVYSDRAKSGGSLIGRDGALALMADARAGRFAAVVVEALDRLSRDMEDLAGLWKRLTAMRIEIVAVGEGQVTTALVGLRGLVGQLYREDNAAKIRRTLAGHVREGLSAGGLPYGYAPVPGSPGQRSIVDSEAEIVRRIFARYVAGDSPREIAAALNAEGVRPPRGTRWNGSTIVGSKSRGTGILRNALYGGRLVWNRLTMIRDPDTGRRVSRVNGAGEHQAAEVPALAIVAPEVFEAARARLQERTHAGGGRGNRRRHLLSGLLRCAACGAGLSSHGRQRDGRLRVRCAAARESRGCSDPHSFWLAEIETRVLAGLERELLDPAACEAYLAGYAEEARRLASAGAGERRSVERQIAALDREGDRCVDLMVKGIGDTERLGARTKEIAVEIGALKQRLAALPQMPETGIVAHPALLASYRAGVEQLRALMADGLPVGAEAATAVRELVDSVTVGRDADGGMVIAVAGRLDAILGRNGPRTSSGGTVVAEEGFARHPRTSIVCRFPA